AVPVFISALLSYAVVVLIQGPSLAFSGASRAGLTSGAYGLVILFGLVMGLIAVCWHTIFNKTKGLVDKIKLDSKYKPILGGLVTGAIGVFFVGDGIFGLGHEGIDAAFLGEFTIGMLLLLAAAKMVATSFTLASGGSGGLFTPTLYIGAMFGGALGLLFVLLWPQTVTDPTLFAIIGMGALFAGASQCPINTIIMIPEMTGNYALIFPQMVASLISYAVFRLFKRGSSIYTIKLERRGVPIKMGGQIDLSRIKASDIMATDVPVVDSHITLSQLEDINLQRKLTVYPVTQEGNLIGSIATSKIIEIPHDLHDEIRVEELVTRGIITAPPDTPVEKVQAMRVENGIDCLFVVDKSDPTKILGIISHAEILSIYERLKAGHLKIGNVLE
ncbi:MAG TPA: chloride channel protein, partial [Candidatus Lokiarchaeia archaeon]|nr:chloride channel protein [Candidatus Lokiarchaeia archaeon]